MKKLNVESIGYGMFKDESGKDYVFDFGPDGSEILIDNDGVVSFIVDDERDDNDNVVSFIVRDFPY